VVRNIAPYMLIQRQTTEGGRNIESVPSEAGPDLGGIEQGISNYEVEIAAATFGGLAMTMVNRFLGLSALLPSTSSG